MNISYQNIIDRFELKAHPEGGFFRESYRSEEVIAHKSLPPRFAGDRSFSTAIYFLLPAGSKSCLHRIQADEVWHFYLGGPLLISQIFDDGHTEEIILGQDLHQGKCLQYVVPAGCWFGSRPLEGTDYSFVGCTVAPGFDFADFEMAKRSEMLKQFPAAKDIILKLTD